MIFYFNETGEQIGMSSERVFQGSTKVGGIVAVCPSSSANTVTLKYELPDGTADSEIVMKREDGFDDLGLETANGVKYSAWSCDMPNSITAQAGTVKFQFCITSVGGATLTTSTTAFTVEKGIVSVEPDRLDAYAKVLEVLTDVNSRIDALENNKQLKLFKYEISGVFRDDFNSADMRFDNLTFISDMDLSDTDPISKAITYLSNAIAITGGSIDYADASYLGKFAPIKFTDGYGVTAVLCMSHESITVNEMLFINPVITVCNKTQMN